MRKIALLTKCFGKMSLLNCVPCVLKTCSRTNVPCVLTYQRVFCAHVPACLACSRALQAYVLTCQRALRASVITCQLVLRTYVITCQRSVRAHMPTCFACSRANAFWVLTCLTCQHALLIYSRVNGACELTCSRVNMPWVPCLTWLA